ncbi:MAG: hypothetical protein ROZ09_15165 [Thiobacillus sp.]|uniref:hypothetical protein n=1 Tax=Thiobacillus sp. TaxID=924 RepID=UPI00289413CF|nr:hypothetical protein [Thiobacillus sp.]MDT3708160.1 hypothetical protein [Thiobacillus sp.]
MIRAELPDEQKATLDQIKRLIGIHAGGARVYVPAHKKRSHLETIAAAGDQATAEQLAKILGVSVRRAQQLKRLR